MTVEEAVAELDSLRKHDPESSHGRADQILAEFAPEPIREALERLKRRCDWWACA